MGMIHTPEYRDDYARVKAIELQYQIEELQEKLKTLPENSEKYSDIQDKINKLSYLQHEIYPLYIPHYVYTPPEPDIITKTMNFIFSVFDTFFKIAFLFLGGWFIYEFICDFLK